MADKPLFKWFIRIVCVLMAMNIIMTLISACLVPGMDTIIYTRSGEDAFIIRLDFRSREILYMPYNKPEFENRWMTGAMTDLMALRLKFAAALANAPLWVRSYGSGEDEEAKSWAMDMYFGNRVKSTHGNGDMPINGKMLISRIEALVRLFPEDLPKQTVPANIYTADI